MATIKSQMVLNDGISGVLRKISAALDTTLSAFEQVQRASGRAVDAAQIHATRAMLVEANRDINDMEEGYHRAAEQEEKLNQGIRSGTTAAGGLLDKVKGIVVAMGGLAAIKKVVGISDQLAGTRARLNLIVDDGGSVDDLEAKIMASAQRSRAAYFDTADAIAKIGANAGAAFSGNDEMISFMEQINKQFVIGGATAQGQSAAMLQLTQAMAAGVLRGEELSSILENAPGIARAIEQYMSVAEGSIKKYAEQGLITAEVVKNAMFAAADETNAKFESMPKTWEQVWTGMKNKALTVFKPILAKINQIVNDPKFQKAVNGLIKGLAAVAAVATWVLDLLIQGGAFIVDNWSWIAPIVMGIVTALMAYHGVMLLVNTVDAISNGLKALSAAHSVIKTGATLAEAGATTTATGAQAGLNAALLACPIMWVILLIIALVAALVLLWDKCEGFRNFMINNYASQTKALAGFYNNTVVPIANKIIGQQNNLLDSGKRFCAATINLFADLAISIMENLSFVTDKVRGLMEIYNKVAGHLGAKTLDLDLVFSADGINALRNTALQSLDAGYAKFEKYAKWNKYPSLDLDKVNNWVDGLAEEAREFRVSDYISGLLGSFTEGLGGESTLGEIGEYTGQTADNTGAAADALTVSSEQLAYLRDIAERDAINRFTTAEVKIDMTGMTNKIEGSADLDGLISAFTEDFADALLTAAEGVHP